MRNPESILENLRIVSKYLIPYTLPQASQEEEEYIAPLKKIDMEVDGYSLVVHFNKADYEDYYLETFQILGENSPFLPFHLVVKLARKMLGGHHLSLVEFFQDNRKIYCWSVCLDRHGRPIPSPIESESKSCEFEGFEYKYMHPSQLNFY